MTKYNKAVHLDDVLEKYNQFGRYHVFMFSLLNIVFLCNSMYSVNFIFVAEDVPYRLLTGDIDLFWSWFRSEDTDRFRAMVARYISVFDPTGIGINFDRERNDYFVVGATQDKCYRHPASAAGACLSEDFNTSTTIACDEWVYKDPTSFVAELACQEWKRTFVGTVHMVGLMCGLLLMGPVSDRFGRKVTIVLTATAGGVLGILKSFVTSYWLYVILEFFSTFIGDSYSAAFTMSIEIVSKEKRVLYQTLGGLSYAFGGAALAGIAWALPYWRDYLRAIYAPAILFILYAFLLDESPRWLLSKNRREEAVKILEKAAKMNGLTIEKEVFESLKVEDEPEKTDLKVVLMSTIKSKILFKRLLVCMFWWMTITFVSYGITINVVSLAGNKYLNFMWLHLIEIPSVILVVYMFIHFKRQKPLFIAFILGGVICLSQPFLPTDMSWLLTTFYLGGKCVIEFSFNAVYIYTSELFPTYTRNSMHALCSAVGRIGSMLAPQTPLLISYWSALPALLFGMMSTISGLLTLLISDAEVESLPDTVRQAELKGTTSEQITKL